MEIDMDVKFKARGSNFNGSRIKKLAALRDMDDQIKAYKEDIKKHEERIDELNKFIKLQKTANAKRVGFVVESVGDLACDYHPDTSFKVIGKFETSRFLDFKFDDVESLLYTCEGCEDRLKEAMHHEPTVAYECSGCGIVYGYPAKDDLKLDYSRTHHSCYVCGTSIGCEK